MGARAMVRAEQDAPACSELIPPPPRTKTEAVPKRGKFWNGFSTSATSRNFTRKVIKSITEVVKLLPKE